MSYISKITDFIGLTTDRNDPDLGHGSNDKMTFMNKKYLVLSDEERARGFVRPLRTSYVHDGSLGGCGAVTTMGLPIAETYARQFDFYGSTYCCGCNKHRPVGENGEFYWIDEANPYSAAGGNTGVKVGT